MVKVYLNHKLKWPQEIVVRSGKVVVCGRGIVGELQQIQFFGFGNRLGAPVDTQFAIEVFGVIVNGIKADE